jgi:hypothetical protein
VDAPARSDAARQARSDAARHQAGLGADRATSGDGPVAADRAGTRCDGEDPGGAIGHRREHRRDGVTMRLTIDDIFELYLRYVPESSRHDNADEEADSWWPAHELGHLLTVPPRQIGLPWFGLPVELGPYEPGADRSYAYELAAMSVSRRLLEAARRPKLFDSELENSNLVVIHYGSRASARRILRRRGVLRLPRDRVRLETMVRRAVGLLGLETT